MTLYCVIGRKRSGKDTLVKIIQEFLPNLKRIAFADNLKIFCAELYKIDKNYFFDDNLKDKNLPEPFVNTTPRQIVCQIGQTFRKRFHENFWIDKMLLNLNSDQDYIISDCRFPNEAQIMHEKGAKLIYIDADKRLGQISSSEDVSEKIIAQTVSQFDKNELLIIQNNDCEEKFRLQAIFNLKLS